MNVRLGLTHPSSGWEQLVQQEGGSHEVVDVFSSALIQECSLLIVCSALTTAEREAVQKYLRDGGAVIGYVAHLTGLPGCESRPGRIEYIVADHDEIFPDVHLLDLGVEGAIPREANCLRLDTNNFALYAGALGGGFAVLLPFDLSKALHDGDAISKSFYGSLERLPTERVSRVGKGEMRQLVRRSFELLHRMRGIPYVHLWYFPEGKENTFAFRIDTDGAPQRDVDELYEIASEHRVGMSWYLDVKSHEQWLPWFTGLRGQEIGIHCYEHTTFESIDTNVASITRARKLMQSAGLRPEGFTAPFGVWHTALAAAIDQVGFAYSSEFSYAYDTFPLYPESSGKTYETLQVPIHPVCIGSLLRIGYTEEQMVAYFQRMVEQKRVRQEPLFFYHHPTHRCWSVVAELFRSVRKAGIPDITLGDFARWWKHRLSIHLDVRSDGQNVFVVRANGPGGSEAWVRIVRPDGREAVVPIEDTIRLDDLTWRPQRLVPPPDDIRRIREFDPRSALGDLYTRMMRKFT